MTLPPLPPPGAITPPPMTQLEQLCLIAIAALGGPNCPICRSPLDGRPEQQHRRAVLKEMTR